MKETMSTELTETTRHPLINLGGIAQNKYATNESLSTEIKTNTFLPYMKLYGSNSNEVKERKIACGSYGMIENQNLVDLGEVVNAMPIAWRWKAVRIIGDQFETYYNPNTDDFKSIKENAKAKLTGNMFGPEVLLWLADSKKFATWHMSNESAQRESGNLTSACGTPVVLKCRLASNKKFKWEAPVILASSTPIELPDEAELMRIAEAFANPRETENTQVSTEAGESVESDRR